MFQERLEALYPIKGSAWDKAFKVGFPTRKVESYRKVLLNELNRFPFNKRGEELLDLSSFSKPLMVLPMEEAKKTYGHFLENRLKERIRKESDFFSLLNDALCEKGYFIYVPMGVQIEEPVDISFCYSGEHSHFAPHIQIFVGKGATVKFRMQPQFSSFQSGVVTQGIDLYLDKNAGVEWVEEIRAPETLFYSCSFKASLKKDAQLQLWNTSKGSNFFRQQFRVELLEEGSSASLKGAAFLEQNRVSHTDVLIEHKAPNARSNQHFKAVINDRSSATFEGKIYVEPEAQKTEAYQLNNYLLLGKESTAFSKPNLEIFADDVKASHGATVSNLSEEELFYFRTRGISKELASSYLATGFLDEIIKDIPKWHLIQNW